MYKRITLRALSIIFIARAIYMIIAMRPGNAGRAMLLIYCIVPFLSLSLVPKTRTWMWRGAAYIALIFVLLGKWVSLPYRGAAVLVIGIAASIDYHHKVIRQRSHIRARAVAYVHSSILCIAFVLAGSLSLMGKGKSFSLTCEQFHNAVTEHISTVLTPFRVTGEQISSLKDRIDDFFTQTPADIAKQHIIGNVTTTPTSQQLDAIASNNSDLAGLISYYKNILIEQPVLTKQNLDNKLCDIVFTQIRERYKKPGFQISILLTLVLFFYPLIKFLTMIVAVFLSRSYRGLKKIGFIQVVSEPEMREKWVV